MKNYFYYPTKHFIDTPKGRMKVIPNRYPKSSMMAKIVFDRFERAGLNTIVVCKVYSIEGYRISDIYLNVEVT